jgi:phosphate transport system protein
VAEVQPIYSVPRLGRHALGMLKDVLDAHNNRDVDLAMRVRDRDAELDELYTSLFRELLTYMMEDPRNITASTHILFIAKNIERIGDHATNIAEQVHFIVKGEVMVSDRMKGGQARGAYDAMPQTARR